jgi:hypothetical protein
MFEMRNAALRPAVLPRKQSIERVQGVNADHRLIRNPGPNDRPRGGWSMRFGV